MYLFSGAASHSSMMYQSKTSMIWIVHQIFSKYVYDSLERITWSLTTCQRQATPEISTVISSSAGVLVADSHGSIHLLNRDFESINSWIAHVGGRVTHMVERRDILVTLGVRLFIGDMLHDSFINIFLGRRRRTVPTTENMGLGK